MACRAADDQHATALRGVGVLTRRLLNLFARVEPFDRQLEIRIGETRPGFSRARAFVVLVVGLPRDVDDVGDLLLDLLELGIVEPLAQTTLELLSGELDIPLALAHVDRHVPSVRHRSNPAAAALRDSL